MGSVMTPDGTEIFYKDWGSSQLYREPLDDSGRLSVKLVDDAELKVYPRASHGLFQTHREQLNADLLDFVQR